MILIIIHAKTGDTVAGVVRLTELDAMNINYTIIPSDGTLSELLLYNTDLSEDVMLLMDTYLTKADIGLN